MCHMADATTARRTYAPRLSPDARREQLLDAALTIALDRGFHAVTVDGVARLAGVTRPVVYGLFADRTDLLVALVNRAETSAAAQLAPVLPPVPGPGDDTDPDELLVAGVAAYLSAVQDDPRTWRVILVPPEGAPPALQERVTAQRRLAFGHLRALIEWGLARRGGPSGVDVELFPRAVITLAGGAGRLVLADPSRWPVERFTEFTRATLDALSPAAMSPAALSPTA